MGPVMGGYVKTFMLMAALTALFMGIGAILGGGTGAIIALVVAAGMNVFTYWNSDRAVLSMTGAREVDSRQAPQLVDMVNQMADRAQMPRPRIYIVDTDQPNAFATGRSPDRAAVAATTGLMQRLTPEELAGVMAHELAHIKNHDTLIMTITATFAGAISMLANFGMFFNTDRERQGGMITSIAMMILAPMAAALVQMAISRSREYEADKLGAEICGNPLYLADALRKIDAFAKGIDNVQAERNPALAHMFIINPLHGKARDALFSTHPNTVNRIAALEAMAVSAPRQASGQATYQAPRQTAQPARQGLRMTPPPAYVPRKPAETKPVGSSSIPKVGRAEPKRNDDGPWS